MKLLVHLVKIVVFTKKKLLDPELSCRTHGIIGAMGWGRPELREMKAHYKN